MDFVFYDLETTGTSPGFDQPLQFAAIRTDENLVRRESVNIRCRLAPHIIPSPKALIVTGIHPDRLADPELPSSFEFAQEIAALTEKWAPAIWTGYNTMRFDEEFLRQAFYQNLQPNVYATQFNGNMRFDVLPAVHAAHVRNPALFDWPVDHDGRLTFRLDRLAPENGFDAHDAHDALGDVEATIHIAGKIVADDPALWSELLDNVRKHRVQEKLESFRPHALIARFDGNDPRAHVGCFCGYAVGNGTRAGFFDLDAADPAELIHADDATLSAAVARSSEIIRGVSTNKAPALLEISDPDPEHLRRAQVIADAPEFHRRVGRAMADLFAEDPTAPPKPVEKQIYKEFYSHADKRLLNEFQRADWPERQEIAASLSDSRLRRLGRRLTAFYSPELLSPKEQTLLGDYLREKWNAPDAPETEWMTLAKAQTEIAELEAESAADRAMLREMATFIERWTARSPD